MSVQGKRSCTCTYGTVQQELGPWTVHDVITDKLRFTREWSTHGQPWLTVQSLTIIDMNTLKIMTLVRLHPGIMYISLKQSHIHNLS